MATKSGRTRNILQSPQSLAIIAGIVVRLEPLQKTQHTLTNINVIKRFINVSIEVRPIDDKIWHIEIG